MTARDLAIVTRSPQRLIADPRRVVTRLFVPGQEPFEHQESRAGAVLARLLSLSEDEVATALGEVFDVFEDRHRDLRATFARHAAELADRLDPQRRLTDARALLLGATFTNEYAIEGAALCNPSVVAHPDQSGTEPGSLRLVMSVRAIGEGHRSTIGFRTGTVDSAGQAVIDDPAGFAGTGCYEPVLLQGAAFRADLRRAGRNGEVADYILGPLGEQFTRQDLDERIDGLWTHRSTRGHVGETVEIIRRIARRFYAVRFAADTALSERVLWPAMDDEQSGMEDARFVRFVDDDGSVRYLATYTAYSGSAISQQLLTTVDFQTFTCGPLVGDAASNKGLAIFPRRIGGRYAALSRSDRETNTVAFSDDPAVWATALPCQQPAEIWETLQLGNCGPPMETDAGWLVLTHGVGPMRSYAIGAILLDIDDPTRIVGRLRQPLLAPAPGDRNGYVPNVVYSCGALVHADTVVIPFGICDSAVGIATVPLRDLLAALLESSARD